MKRTFNDIRRDVILKLLKPLVYIWMTLDAKRKIVKQGDFSFRMRKPYVLLANHTYLFDVVHVPLRFPKTPFMIGSSNLFTKKTTRFLVSKIAPVISKAKGESDIKTIREIFNVKKRGYPIAIFPEGDTTYFGETGPIEKATMKLIKKLKIDVYACTVKGGYLSRPRYAKGKRKNKHLELDYRKIIDADDLKTMDLNDIDTIVNDALDHNDYKYQRETMIPHPGKHLAEGMEDVVYVCPHCKAIDSIKTSGNTIRCAHCKKEGHVDKYGFIHGFVYDNLVDWNTFQKTYRGKLLASRLKTTATMYRNDRESSKRIPMGEVRLTYHDGIFSFHGDVKMKIPVKDIENPTLTLRRDFGFAYEDTDYILKMHHGTMPFLRVCRDKY